ARARRPHARPGHARGDPRGPADRAHGPRVRAAGVLPAEPRSGAEPRAHRAARLGRELRQVHQRHRRVRELSPAQDRRRLRAEAPAPRAGRRLRAAGARTVSGVRRRASLRWRLTLWYSAALGGLLTLLGATALVLLDRTLRANVDASLVSVAHTVAASSLASAPPGPDLDEALGALLGPALAERFFQLLDPLVRPDPPLAAPRRTESP